MIRKSLTTAALSLMLASVTAVSSQALEVPVLGNLFSTIDTTFLDDAAAVVEDDNTNREAPTHPGLPMPGENDDPVDDVKNGFSGI